MSGKNSIEPASEELHEKLKRLQIDFLRISDELMFLNETIKELNKTLKVEDAMEKFLIGAIRFAHADGGAVFVFQQDGGIVKSKTVEFPEDTDFLCILAEIAEPKQLCSVKDTECLQGRLKEGVLLIRSSQFVYNIKGGIVLYFKNETPVLPDSMEILYETGFSALRNAITFELTSKSQIMGQALIDEIPDMILVWDQSTEIVKCNMAFAKMVGAHPKDIVGMKLSQLPLTQQMKACLNEVISLQEENFTKETRCDGKVFLVTSKKMTLPDERKAYLFVVRDITAIRHLQEQLYHADKLASLGMLVSGVAHEINNPLTGIMGYTELLLMKVEDENIKTELKKIYHSAERCKKIVENLLAFSRQRAPQKASVSVNELIESTLELRSYWLRSNNIKVKKDLRTIPYIKADPQQLQQVFLNLIINAEDALMDSENEEKILELRSYYNTDTNKVIVEIQDNGTGIAEDILPRIFDPFFSTKPFGKGTGLGLSISHGIISEHGGTISVDSTPGQGTKFKIELPVERNL